MTKGERHERYKDLVQQYERDGVSTTELATMYGVTSSSIRSALFLRGATFRKANRQKKWDGVPPSCGHGGVVFRKGLCKICYVASQTLKYRDRRNAYSAARRINDRVHVLALEKSNRAAKSVEQRRYELVKYRYGLSKDMYDLLLTRQEGRCAICKQPFTESCRVHVDHDHTNGVIRGFMQIV